VNIARVTDPIDPRAHRVLAGASRVRVLEHLRERGGAATAAEIGERLGLHPNTVRLHLDQLAEAGLVTRAAQARTGPGRPKFLYSARPADPAPEAESYRTLAGLLAGRLEATSDRPDDDAAAAGRAWGRTLTGGRATDQATANADLLRLMDRLGFAPTQPAPGAPVELHRCPFRAVAEQHSRVVCGIHLGLMQGALESLGAPLQATRLEPFVAPDLCLAHLAPTHGVGELRKARPSHSITQPTEGFPS
jgi:predicted ArsR family transcriptional regulator